MAGKIEVGSVCEIIDAVSKFAHLIGKECTVVARWSYSQTCDWEIAIAGEATNYGAPESKLRLKRPPKDETFERFMDKLNTPVDLPEEELG